MIDDEPPEEIERRRQRDAREAAARAEYEALFHRAVAACVRRGCTPEEAEQIIKEMINELQNEAMKMHYTDHVPREQVDRWYEAQFRSLASD